MHVIQARDKKWPSVVSTPRDKQKWEKAEALAAAKMGKDSPKYYAYVMGIYKRMKPDYEFKGKRAADIDLSKIQMDTLHKDGEVVVDGVKLTFSKTAFNKENGPELLGQLLRVLKNNEMDESLEIVKRCGLTKKLNDEWMSDTTGRQKRKRRGALAQPLMLQPDYGSEDHPCQNGGQCQCGGTCGGRVAYQWRMRHEGSY